MKRREFLSKTLRATCASAMAGSLLGKLSIANAAISGTGYRALVGIYLYGGNDSINMIVPRSAAQYTTYAQTRGALAVPLGNLVPLNPAAGGGPSDGAQYGVPDNMPGLQRLFNEGRAAVVGNVGPLMRYVTKAEYQARTALLPPQLGSHSDQSVFWQTPRAGQAERIGWGGRLVDLYLANQATPNPLASIALDGENVFQSGIDSTPYFLSTLGVQEIDALTGDFNARRRNTFERLLAGPLAHPMERAYRDQMRRTRGIAATLSSELAQSQAQFPDNRAPFNAFTMPDGTETEIGIQLRMVARMLSIRGAFGISRQVFSVGMGGYDTHAGQLNDHPRLMAQLSHALAAFHDVTVALGIANDVTAFTMSEFGRTLTNNGDGTDHGWGGHQVVVGGAVRGQRFYGHMPNLAARDNEDDLDSGQLIPRVAVEQYGATLARWFGLSDVDRATIFPNLGTFDRYGGPNLGFLG